MNIGRPLFEGRGLAAAHDRARKSHLLRGEARGQSRSALLRRFFLVRHHRRDAIAGVYGQGSAAGGCTVGNIVEIYPKHKNNPDFFFSRL